MQICQWWILSAFVRLKSLLFCICFGKILLLNIKYYFRTLKMLLHCLIPCPVSSLKICCNLIFSCVYVLFLLTILTIFFQFLLLNNLIMMCLNVVSLIFLGVYQASHICRFTVLTNFENIYPFVFQIIFLYLSVFSSENEITCILGHLISFNSSLNLCSFCNLFCSILVSLVIVLNSIIISSSKYHLPWIQIYYIFLSQALYFVSRSSFGSLFSHLPCLLLPCPVFSPGFWIDRIQLQWLLMFLSSNSNIYVNSGCMPSNFVLDARHCGFYFVGCCISLFHRNYWAGETQLSYLATTWTFWFCF